MAQLVKNLSAMWETWVQSLVGKIPWKRKQLPTPVLWAGEFNGLQSMESQRVRHDWATELNWTEHIKIFFSGGQTATKIKWNETQGSVEPSVKKYPKMSYIMKTMGAGAIVSLFKLWYWHLFKLVLVKLFNLLFLISYYLNGIIFALKLSEVSYEFFLCDRCGQKHYVLHLSWGS